MLHERFVLRLFQPHPFVLEKVAVRLGQLLHQHRLFMISLQQSILMRSEFLKLRLEELRFLARYRLLVEDEHVGNVIAKNLVAKTPLAMTKIGIR